MIMIDIIKKKINELLEGGSVKAVVALKTVNGHITPCLFHRGDSLDDLNLGDREAPGDTRYPLNRVLCTIAGKYPDDVFGIIVRGCDERGLYTLYRLNQLEKDKVVPIGIPCPEELAKVCECLKPCPDQIVEGLECMAEPVSQHGLENMDAKDIDDRFSFWTDQFLKCVKCYGCRDICPMCFCRECSLECEDLVSKGELPVDIPVFHLTRAMHMADRCIDCGLCEQACPADIPLRLLYKNTARIMKDEFGFSSGINQNEPSPLSQLGPAPEK